MSSGLFRIGCLLLAFTLAGCGDGGGGDDGPPGPRLVLDTTNIVVTAGQESVGPSRSITLTVTNMPAAGVYVGYGHSVNGVANVSFIPNATNAVLQVDFRPGISLPAGVYNDTIEVSVCLDDLCRTHIAGSPQTVRTSYTVTHSAPPEPGVAPLVVASRATLAHDVVDAEYSAALDAVVMVSTWPLNALYVYDMASRAERQLPLNKPPVAVSISPDGLTAAVGHDALVTHVVLTTVGQASPTVRLLSLSSNTSDVVLDGRGTVHVFPATDQWVKVHSIVVATNVETLGNTFPWPYAGNRARLHPSGDTIYAANNGLSPDDIENYHVETGTVSLIGDSRYHGDYAMCGNLWISDDGARITTACGATFEASTVPANDMLYAGSVPLSTGTLYGAYRIQSASTRSASRELALIEQPWYECQDFSQMASACHSHLNLYDSQFLTLGAKFSFPPVVVGLSSYAQRGLFVFHQASGSKLLISRLHAVPDRSAEYLLSVVR